MPLRRARSMPHARRTGRSRWPRWRSRSRSTRAPAPRRPAAPGPRARAPGLICSIAATCAARSRSPPTRSARRATTSAPAPSWPRSWRTSTSSRALRRLAGYAERAIELADRTGDATLRVFARRMGCIAFGNLGVADWPERLEATLALAVESGERWEEALSRNDLAHLRMERATSPPPKRDRARHRARGGARARQPFALGVLHCTRTEMAHARRPGGRGARRRRPRVGHLTASGDPNPYLLGMSVLVKVQALLALDRVDDALAAGEGALARLGDRVPQARSMILGTIAAALREAGRPEQAYDALLRCAELERAAMREFTELQLGLQRAHLRDRGRRRRGRDAARPGRPRPADRAAQPPLPRPRPRRRHARAPGAGEPRRDRPRPLQGGQRPLRPSRRRPRAHARRGAAGGGVRAEDVVARTGGEEFMVLMPRTTPRTPGRAASGCARPSTPSRGSGSRRASRSRRASASSPRPTRATSTGSSATPTTGCTPRSAPGATAPSPGPEPRAGYAGGMPAGIVLAGGRSRRMGTPKAWLDWHGTTLLRRACGIVARGTSGPVIVVRAPGQELPELPARRPRRRGRARRPRSAPGDPRRPRGDRRRRRLRRLGRPAVPASGLRRRRLRGRGRGDRRRRPLRRRVSPAARGRLSDGDRAVVEELVAADRMKPAFLFERVRTRWLEDAPAPRERPQPQRAGRLRGGAGRGAAAGARPRLRPAQAAGGGAAARPPSAPRPSGYGVELGEHVLAALNGDQVARDPMEPLAKGDDVAFMAADAGG